MTKQDILKRIKVLNKKIDNKIINGGNYTKEMVEHANLYHFYKSVKSK